jgi:hypothetical protein
MSILVLFRAIVLIPLVHYHSVLQVFTKLISFIMYICKTLKNMARRAPNFYREGTPFELFQIGKNYAEIKQQIALTLEQLFEEFKREGVIYTLSRYENKFMSQIYLERLVDLGIIKKFTDNNGNIQYKWNGGDNPDFIELTNHVPIEFKF